MRARLRRFYRLPRVRPRWAGPRGGVSVTVSPSAIGAVVGLGTPTFYAGDDRRAAVVRLQSMQALPKLPSSMAGVNYRRIALGLYPTSITVTVTPDSIAVIVGMPTPALVDSTRWRRATAQTWGLHKRPFGNIATTDDRAWVLHIFPVGLSVVVQASAIAAAVGLDAVSLSTGSTVSPGSIGASAGLGAPTARTGATPVVAAIGTIAGLPAVVISGADVTVIVPSIGVVVGMDPMVFGFGAVVSVESIAAAVGMQVRRVQALRSSLSDLSVHTDRGLRLDRTADEGMRSRR